MKKPILISFLTIALIFSSCSSNNNKKTETTEQTASNIAPTISPDFTKSFEGTINGKYGITMVLTKNANILNGTYNYKGKNTPLNISGTIDNNGNLTINEFNTKGSMTGVFKGQLSDNKIIGQWSKPDGSIAMPFSISEFTLTKKLTDWTGTYHNSDSGVLIITNFKEGVSFNYQMTYSGPSSCGGFELSGLARIISITKAEAGEDKENPITLELNGNKIIFMPSCCDGSIGMECLRSFHSDFVKK